MQKYELTYERMNAPQTKTGEAPARIDAHELLLEVLGLGLGGQILGTKSLKESLELMRFTNVSVTWL
jgi:hypothetical protein